VRAFRLQAMGVSAPRAAAANRTVRTVFVNIQSISWIRRYNFK
jgi:hypothetical protein